MASIFDPGTDGGLKSTTLPAALIELLERNQAAEQGVTNAPNRVTNLTYTTETGVVTFGGVIELAGNSSSGGTQYVGVDYLATAFAPGTGGDLTAATLPGALYELLRLVAIAQVGSATSVLSAFTQNNLGTPTATYSGSCRFTRTLDSSGKPSFTITDTL